MIGPGPLPAPEGGETRIPPGLSRIPPAPEDAKMRAPSSAPRAGETGRADADRETACPAPEWRRLSFAAALEPHDDLSLHLALFDLRQRLFEFLKRDHRIQRRLHACAH